MWKIYVSQKYYNAIMNSPAVEKREYNYLAGVFSLSLFIDKDLESGWYIVDQSGKIVKKSPTIC